MCLGMWVAISLMGRSEDNLRQVGSRDSVNWSGPGGKYLYLVSHPAGPYA